MYPQSAYGDTNDERLPLCVPSISVRDDNPEASNRNQYIASVDDEAYRIDTEPASFTTYTADNPVEVSTRR